MDAHKPTVSQRLRSFFVQSTRVWQILRKPSNQEFKSIAKVSAIGILIIGLLGFVLSDILKFLT